MRKSVDAGWDTVDPDKQTAQPAFGKRVTRPKPPDLRSMSYPRRLLDWWQRWGLFKGTGRGMTFCSEGPSVYLSEPTVLLSCVTSFVPSKNERENKSKRLHTARDEISISRDDAYPRASRTSAHRSAQSAQRPISKKMTIT
jgi:hypothetical protein